MNTPLRRKRGGQARKKTFTRELWVSMLARLNEGEQPHPHAAQLAAGIADMRRRLTTTRDSMRSAEMIRTQ